MEYGLYLHIPYCKSRCRYCDFYTRGGYAAVPEAYVEALLRDFAALAPRDGAQRVVPPATVYFGGGTPGLLAPGQVARLLNAVGPAAGAEITLEANPDTTAPAALAGWRAAGVNRLSLGVQTASDASLASLGRRHSAADALAAMQRAGDAGFDNLSMDMMLALPGYTTGELEQSLALAVAGGASHVSAYLLKIERDTPFGRRPPADLPNEDAQAAFYLQAVAALAKAGFAQYEISNFARPGHESRHNLLYWQGGEWLGLGPAAHSHLGGRRFSFAADVDAFLAGPLPPTPQGGLGREEYIMLRLRLAAGLDEARLARRFGTGLSAGQRALLRQLAAGGLAQQTPGGWALTPRGMLVQNSILARLLA